MRVRMHAVALLSLLVAGTLGSGCNSGYTASSTPVSVTVTPHQATLAITPTTSCAAAVSGGSSGDVLWSVQEVGGGMVDASGTYTAPAQTGTFHVVAASMADPSKTDTATVTVTAGGGGPIGITVAVSPQATETTPRGTLPFTAVVAGAGAGPSTAVTWSGQEGAARRARGPPGRDTPPPPPRPAPPARHLGHVPRGRAQRGGPDQERHRHRQRDHPDHHSRGPPHDLEPRPDVGGRRSQPYDHLRDGAGVDLRERGFGRDGRHPGRDQR